MTPTTFNIADLWEAVATKVGDRPAVTEAALTLSYRELDERANRLAHVLTAQAVAPGDHVGVYLLNGIAYAEALLACFKIRAVPININYRYQHEELRYLFEDSDLIGLIAHREFQPSVVEATVGNDKLRFVLSVDNLGEPTPVGTIDYAAACAEASCDRPKVTRSNDDLYVLYTGGTTGMPKGVVWRQEDAFFSCIGAGDPMRLNGPITRPEEILDRVIDFDFTAFPLAPMMHAAAQWVSLSWWLCGARVVLHPGSFDALEVWKTIERERISTLIVVGDAMVRPLIDAWDTHGPFDVSSMFAIGSGGAPLTPSLKDRLMEICPNAMLTDGFGSSETGAQGGQRLAAGERSGGATRFVPQNDNTTVMTADGQVVAPGSGEQGFVALTGRIPLGYYNAPEKTAATFVERDGKRWVLTGDLATVETDGTIALLGRGSQVINTGGEKVFPEEVEAVLKSHSAIYDAVVAGAPDERFGQQVCAVVAFRDGHDERLEGLVDFVRSQLAGYKVPRSMVVVDSVVRSPVGKPDYRWAQEVIAQATADGTLVSRGH